MAENSLITVALIGHPESAAEIQLRLESAAATEADSFNTLWFANDRKLAHIMVSARPQVIFTFGKESQFTNLMASSIEVRRRWVHFDKPPAWSDLASRALAVFVDINTNDRFPHLPLVSVFTPTYQTGERLNRSYHSLVAQQYANWEWVVYDDSPDDETFDRLRQIAHQDDRVRIFRGDGNWGAIGEVKRRLCGLARGSILVELDHDDELTPWCVGSVVEAFQKFPDAGFAYTDCAEMFEDGEPAGYPVGWGFGFGSYRWEKYGDRQLMVTNYPSVNAKTMRHIVGVPNHVRAWRRSAYEAIGGYRPEIFVADDYEILIRTFLHTRMVHIQRCGYLQYIRRDGGNTQRIRNKEIQRLVRLFQQRYDDEIHARFVELGVDDFIWQAPGRLDWSIANPSPEPLANYQMP
jgi:O-antigen biosynthesis protein